MVSLQLFIDKKKKANKHRMELHSCICGDDDDEISSSHLHEHISSTWELTAGTDQIPVGMRQGRLEDLPHLPDLLPICSPHSDTHMATRWPSSHKPAPRMLGAFAVRGVLVFLVGDVGLAGSSPAAPGSVGAPCPLERCGVSLSAVPPPCTQDLLSHPTTLLRT